MPEPAVCGQAELLPADRVVLFLRKGVFLSVTVSSLFAGEAQVQAGFLWRGILTISFVGLPGL